MFALDTNTVIYFFKGLGRVGDRLLFTRPSEIAIPAVVPADRLAAAVPSCERIAREGLPCPACGLTRSFYAMSSGETETAKSHHRLGPAIYTADLLNAGAAILFSILTVIRGRF